MSNTPPFPISATIASRDELDGCKLNVVEGVLPDDLQGHCFVVAPVGNVESDGLPMKNGEPVLNGDGMLFRFDLGREAITVKSRIMKPPDYFADSATKPGSTYEHMSFVDAGITRASIPLGFRNFLNTAMLPMGFSSDPLPRMLMTYDGGRPYEIDTDSLELATCVGTNEEWHEYTLKNIPFRLRFTSAHPVFDSNTDMFYTANYSSSLLQLLKGIPLIGRLAEIPGNIHHGLDLVADLINPGGTLRRGVDAAFAAGQETLANLDALKVAVWPGAPDSVTYIVGWAGDGHLERWKLVLPDGSPVKIKQTIHQIGLTRDYLVVMDTAFKFGVDELYDMPFKRESRADRLLRFFTSSPQLPYTAIYLVPRAQLVDGERPALDEDTVEVTVSQAQIPLETVHFLVDYDNPEGVVTIHATHGAATDVAEWLRPYDYSRYTGDPINRQILGFPAMGEMDISRMGRYELEGPTGRVVSSKTAASDLCTWAMAFYAAQGVPAWGAPPGRLKQIFWYSGGYWNDFLSQFIYDKYADYEHRLIRLEELLAMPEQGGRPCTLFRLDTETLDFADVYAFGPGYLPASPQFVPRRGGDPDDPLDGYIIMTVYFGETREVWIFDAKDLAGGPTCRLHSDELVIGQSLHTAWVPKVGPRTASYYVSPREDLKSVLEHFPQLRAFFDKEVFPNLPNGGW